MESKFQLEMWYLFHRHHLPNQNHCRAPFQTPAKYTFSYDVSDHYSGVDFEHTENRDGHKTDGGYTVNLPDGRKKVVTYVDNGHGLMADVKVTGKITQSPKSGSYH